MPYLQLGESQFPLSVGEIGVGSAPGAAILLPGGGQALEALLNTSADGGVSIRRARPDAIVRVNGVQLGMEPAPLLHGDKLEIGGHELFFGDERRSGGTHFITERAHWSTEGVGAHQGAPTSATGGRLISLVDGREYPVPREGLTLGRDPGCDVVIPAGESSRRHARVTVGVEGYEVHDTSTNGVFINGMRIERSRVLGRGDVIRIASEEFRFYADLPAPEVSGHSPAEPPAIDPQVSAALAAAIRPSPPAERKPEPVPPVQPAQPARPAQPAQPAQPARPAQPEQSARPAQPAQPGRQADPVAPAKPSAPGAARAPSTPPGPPAAPHAPAPGPPSRQAPPAASPSAPVPRAPAPSQPFAGLPPLASPPTGARPDPAVPPATRPADSAPARSQPHPQAAPGSVGPAPPASPPADSSDMRSVLATLEILNEGVRKGTRFDVRTPLAHIGRGPHNDIVLHDESVSETHAKLQRREGGWTLVDLNSTNGTYVAGRRVHGDQRLEGSPNLRFGGVKMSFRSILEVPLAAGGTRQITGVSVDQLRQVENSPHTLQSRGGGSGSGTPGGEREEHGQMEGGARIGGVPVFIWILALALGALALIFVWQGRS